MACTFKRQINLDVISFAMFVCQRHDFMLLNASVSPKVAFSMYVYLYFAAVQTYH